tara:strand:+ start:608 stop:880 length:273 start_codon:yes stop_codon:yes gene_type:complete
VGAEMILNTNFGLITNDTHNQAESMECTTCGMSCHHTTAESLYNDHNIEGLCHHCAHNQDKIDNEEYNNLCQNDESQYDTVKGNDRVGLA